MSILTLPDTTEVIAEYPYFPTDSNFSFGVTGAWSKPKR